MNDKKCQHSGDINNDGKDFCILHGLYGCEVETVLKSINDFLVGHKSEVVILDFQHIFGLNRQDCQVLAQMMERIFGSRVCPCNGSSIPSLEYMNSHGYQVIAVNKIYNCDAFWPRKFCPNPWPNTTNINQLDQYLTNHLHSREPTKLFVSQCILTANMKTILKNPFRSLETVLVNPCDRFLISKWLPKVKISPYSVNIVMVDFVEKEQGIPYHVILMNY